MCLHAAHIVRRCYHCCAAAAAAVNLIADPYGRETPPSYPSSNLPPPLPPPPYPHTPSRNSVLIQRIRRSGGGSVSLPIRPGSCGSNGEEEAASLSSLKSGVGSGSGADPNSDVGGGGGGGEGVNVLVPASNGGREATTTATETAPPNSCNRPPRDDGFPRI